MISIMMAGGVYCPLTPDEPRARLELLFDESRASCTLIHNQTVEHLANRVCLNLSTIIMEILNSSYRYCQPINLKSPQWLTSSSPAIIIFTSGSTGKPKGIQMTHGNFIHSLSGVETDQLLIRTDTVLQRTPVTFDMHLQDILGSLMLGSCLVLLPPGGDRDLDYILDAIEKYQISCLSTVPTVWTALIEHQEMLKYKLANLRILLSSGCTSARELHLYLL